MHTLSRVVWDLGILRFLLTYLSPTKKLCFDLSSHLEGCSASCLIPCLTCFFTRSIYVFASALWLLLHFPQIITCLWLCAISLQSHFLFVLGWQLFSHTSVSISSMLILGQVPSPYGHGSFVIQLIALVNHGVTSLNHHSQGMLEWPSCH